jgi:hypothetical protein
VEFPLVSSSTYLCFLTIFLLGVAFYSGVKGVRMELGVFFSAKLVFLFIKLAVLTYDDVK